MNQFHVQLLFMIPLIFLNSSISGYIVWRGSSDFKNQNYVQNLLTLISNNCWDGMR